MTDAQIREAFGEAPYLKVFVYGTLKRGQSNHEHFCCDVLEIEVAATPGRLYELPFGFPGLRVPGEVVRAVGSTDYLADAGKQRRSDGAMTATAPGWDTVHGEVITFADPERRLVALDGLEGYVPGESSLYERVLIPIQTPSETALGWAYVLKKPVGVYLPGGRWPAP